jgi:aspartate racemase
MKCMGIVGGLSPESTIYYYQHIIHQYYKKFKNHNYPKIVIYSVSIQNYIDWGDSGNHQAIADDLVSAIGSLVRAGADFALISANTPHIVFESVKERVNIPLLNIVEPVCQHASELGIENVALLGTKITMNADFYPKAFNKAGIEVLVPDEDDKELVHEIIFKELTSGIIRNESKIKYIEIINKLARSGAQAVILGCTEIPLLIKPEEVEIMVLDSSIIHADAALNYALNNTF